MAHSTTLRFYVYTLARPDGSVFYVGKGSGDRIYRHEMLARRGVTGHRYNIIRKVWAQGGEIIKQIVLWTDDERTAFEYEARLIASYGRSTLANRSDGGEGPVDHTVSAEGRARMSAAARNRSPEHRAKLSRPHTPAARAKMTAARTGRKLTAEHRANQSRAKTGVKFSPEHRANLSAALKEAMNRPEMVERRKAYRHSDEAKAKIAESNRRRAQRRRENGDS